MELCILGVFACQWVGDGLQEEFLSVALLVSGKVAGGTTVETPTPTLQGSAACIDQWCLKAPLPLAPSLGQGGRVGTGGEKTVYGGAWGTLGSVLMHVF